jgi:murein DD-endopeptidase MepM/ murein hydrolase activator NlpD
VRVDDSDVPGRGQPLAQVGNSGESDEPHVHMHVQNRPYDYTGHSSNLFTYPTTFRDANVTPSGIRPRADAGELHGGDRIQPGSPPLARP